MIISVTWIWLLEKPTAGMSIPDVINESEILFFGLQVFSRDREFRDAAIEAGEVVWKNGLVKKVGLSDGVAGNAYAFLSLYRLTGEPVYEERAKAFASFLYHNAGKLVTVGHAGTTEHAYSLFQGLAGTACLLFDLLSPENSRFPGYEL